MFKDMLKQIKKSVLYVFFFITLLIQFFFLSSKTYSQDTTELEYETYTEVWVSSDSNYQDSSYYLFDDYCFDSVLKFKTTPIIERFERKATNREPRDDEVIRCGKVRHYRKIDTPLKVIKKDTFRVYKQKFYCDSLLQNSKLKQVKPINEKENESQPDTKKYRLDLMVDIRRYEQSRWIPWQNI